MKIIRFFILTKLLILSLLSFASHAAFQQGVPPAGSDGGLIAVAAGTDKYIAVGLFTKVMQSSDGISWT